MEALDLGVLVGCCVVRVVGGFIDRFKDLVLVVELHLRDQRCFKAAIPRVFVLALFDESCPLEHIRRPFVFINEIALDRTIYDVDARGLLRSHQADQRLLVHHSRQPKRLRVRKVKVHPTRFILVYESIVRFVDLGFNFWRLGYDLHIIDRTPNLLRYTVLVEYRGLATTYPLA